MGRAVLWIVAGFSRPAGGPVASELLSARFLIRSKANPKYLSALQELVDEFQPGGAPDLEAAFSTLWRNANVTGRITIGGTSWDAEKLLQQLRIHLASVTSRSRFRANGGVHREYSTFFAKLFRRSRRVTIITTNYDLVVERLFDGNGESLAYGRHGDFRLEKGFPWRRWVIPPKTRLLNLHGSSNWGLCNECETLSVFGRPYLPRSRRRCAECSDGFLDSAIVPPIVSRAGELGFLRGTWRLAEEELGRADSFMVIGYSLPPADLEVRSLLSATASRGAVQHTTIVAGSDPGTRSRYAELLPGACWSGDFFEDYLKRNV